MLEEETYKKTMGFQHLDVRSPKTKARVKSIFKPSVPEPTKLADSGFISQGHQIKQYVRKLKGKRQLDQATGKAYTPTEPRTGLSTRHKKPTYFSGKAYAPFVRIRKPDNIGV